MPYSPIALPTFCVSWRRPERPADITILRIVLPRATRIGAPQPTSWHRDRAHVLRHSIALLHRRPVGDGHIPAFHVGVLVHVDGLPLEARDPRPDRDVGDRIGVGDELA